MFHLFYDTRHKTEMCHSNGSYSTRTLDRTHVTATLLLPIWGPRIRESTDGAAILAGVFRGFHRFLQVNTGLGQYFLLHHDRHISHLL